MGETITFKMDRLKSLGVMVLGLGLFLMGSTLALKSNQISSGDIAERYVLILIGLLCIVASLFILALAFTGVIKSPDIIVFNHSEVTYYYSFLHTAHKQLTLPWSDIEDIRLKSLSYLKKTECGEIPTESDFITLVVKKGVLDKKFTGKKGLMVVNDKVSISTALLSDFSSKRLGEVLKQYHSIEFDK